MKTMMLSLIEIRPWSQVRSLVQRLAHEQRDLSEQIIARLDKVYLLFTARWLKGTHYIFRPFVFFLLVILHLFFPSHDSFSSPSIDSFFLVIDSKISLISFN